MIIQTGMRTDIPAFYSKWLINRLNEGNAFIDIAAKYGMPIRPCAKGNDLAAYGADCSGCVTVKLFENALHERQIQMPSLLKEICNVMLLNHHSCSELISQETLSMKLCKRAGLINRWGLNLLSRRYFIS